MKMHDVKGEAMTNDAESIARPSLREVVAEELFAIRWHMKPWEEQRKPNQQYWLRKADFLLALLAQQGLVQLEENQALPLTYKARDGGPLHVKREYEALITSGMEEAFKNFKRVRPLMEET